MPTTLDRSTPTRSLDTVDAASPLVHSIHRCFEELREIESQWNEFVEQSGGDLYASYDWCRTWWHHYGDRRDLEVHVFRRDDRIVGLLPTFRERLTVGLVTLRLIRLVGCDHSTTTCGVVVAPGEIEAVIAAFTERLSQDLTWDMVQWSPLAGYFPHRQAIANAFCKSRHWTVRSSADGGPHVVWDLPESFDDFLAGLSKKERSNIKIARKKLTEGASIVDSAATPEEAARWFPVFLQQHQTQWQAEGKLGHFADWPQAESFHKELASRMAAQGRLQLLRMDVAGHPIGFQYNYRFGRRIHWLLGSRDIDPKWDAFSSGRVLHVETIERAIANSDAGIDGLRGLYDYKLRLGGKITQLQSISLIRRKRTVVVKFHVAQLFARFLDLLYYRIWFSRIAPWLPFRRRGLWKLWIRSRI